MLGTCHSIGCTVDGKSPRDIVAKINSGEIKVWFINILLISESTIYLIFVLFILSNS